MIISAPDSLSAGFLVTGIIILLGLVFASSARVRIPLLLYLAIPLLTVIAADVSAMVSAKTALTMAAQASTLERPYAVIAALETAIHRQASAFIVFGLLMIASSWAIALSTALSVRRGGKLTPIRSLVVVFVASILLLTLWLLVPTNPLSLGTALIPLCLLTPTLLLSSYDSKHPSGSSRCAAATFSAALCAVIGAATILLSMLYQIETSGVLAHLLDAPARVLVSRETAELALDAQSALFYCSVSSLTLIAVAAFRLPKAISVRTTFSSLGSIVAISVGILLHLLSNSALEPVKEIITANRVLNDLKNPSVLPYSVTASGDIAGSPVIGDVLIEQRYEGWTKSILHGFSTLTPPKFIVAAPAEEKLAYLLRQEPITPLRSFTVLTSSDHIKPMFFGVDLTVTPESDPMKQPLWVSHTKHGIGLFITDKYIGDIHDKWINTRFRLARQQTNAESIRFVINDDWSLAEFIGTCLTVKKFVAADLELSCEISFDG